MSHNAIADALRRRGVTQRKKVPSGTGDGIWETVSSLAKYRRRRNKARKVSRASRLLNRERER